MRTLFFATALFFATSGFAQQHFVGITGGGGLSNMSGSQPPVKRKNQAFLQGGVSYAFHFARFAHIETDLIYTSRGYNNIIHFTDDVGSPTGETMTNSRQFSYLALPVKAGVHFGNKLLFFLNVGVVSSRLLRAEFRSPGVAGVMPSQTYNITEIVQPFDFAGLAELGVSFPLSNSFYITTNVGYAHSFTSHTTPNYHPHRLLYHYGLTGNLGLKYRFGREK